MILEHDEQGMLVSSVYTVNTKRNTFSCFFFLLRFSIRFPEIWVYFTLIQSSPQSASSPGPTNKERDFVIAEFSDQVHI